MASRGAAIWRNVRVNLLILGGFAAVALLVLRMERAVPLLAERGEEIDYLAGIAAGADYDAASELEIFELRRRFRAKLTECLGVTGSTRPFWIEDRPQRLILRHASEAGAVVAVDFAALKAEGPFGAFVTLSDGPAATPELKRGVTAIGLLGVYAPERPCPPRPEAG